jgi:hypothetical protein
MSPNGKSALAAKVREAVESLAAARAMRVAEREALESERDALLDAPLNRDDTKALMLAYADRIAEEWMESANWPRAFRDLTYPDRYPGRAQNRRAGVGEVPPVNLRDFDLVAVGNSAERATVVGLDGLKLVSGHSTWLRLCDGALFALFADVLKPRLAELFERHYSDPLAIDAGRIGPPIAERRARIAEIETKLSALATEIAEIDSEARELGVNLAETGTGLAGNGPQAGSSVPVYELNLQTRPFTAAEVSQMTGMEVRELRECASLRPLPPDHDQPGIRYDANAVRAWIRARAAA